VEPLGSGKREWGEKREGGGQYTSKLVPEWTGITPHAKEGFQVSKRGSGTNGGSFQAKGDYQGDCAMCLRYDANLVHIMKLCVLYLKRTLFRL
jgi:hypothetical protein